jgi:hypothetical protein
VRRESSIEKAFARIAAKLFEAYGQPHKYVKTVTPGRKGWPDRLLLFGPGGHHLYIEWKQPGEVPDDMQVEVHKEIRALGAEVRWYDNHYTALVEVETFVRAKVGAGPWDETNRPEWWDQIVLKARKGQDLYSTKVVRGPKTTRPSGRLVGPRSSARRDDLVALRIEQVGGLSASKLRDDPWWENGTLEGDGDDLGCILDEYRGLADE